MQSNASTAIEYLEALPANRQKIMMALRKTIRKNLPKGFEEVMQYGMLSYVVPHEIYPDGYHCNPEQALPFLSVASQKNYISVYHMGLYEGALLDWFTKEWKAHTDKKPDMGKCCIRFKKPDDIPLDLIGALAAKMTPQEWIAHYEKSKPKK